MDQLKSTSMATPASGVEPQSITAPKRTYTVEFFVGIFAMVGVAAAGWLAVGLGGVQFLNTDHYTVESEFDNVSGLQVGAAVEVGGVPVGEVQNIHLKDPQAIVTLSLYNWFKLRDDDIASIRTKGIIGDRYVKISRGASSKYIPAGGMLTDTESVVDIEDIIGKLVHSLSGDKEKDKPDTTDSKNEGSKKS